MGGRGRKSLLFLVLLSLVLVGLSLTAGGCDDDGGVKATVNAYYDAVIKGDKAGQIAQWLPDRQAEADREADAWTARDKDGLKIAELHVTDGPTGDQRLVHLTIASNDKARPGRLRYETRTLLVQQGPGGWRILDAK